MATENKSILEGIRIVEVGVFINGIGAGYMLGDMGAEVIKVEDPVRGDPYRGLKQMYGDTMYVKGRHMGYELFNRNKRDIIIDLKKEKGRELFYELIKQSDVFLTNYNDRVCKDLGIDYDTLKKHNDKIIYAVASGYGSKGKLAGERGFDLLAMARSGFMWQMGEREHEEPVVVAIPMCDTMGSVTMAYGIICALLARERLGISQKIETSLLGSTMFLNCYGVMSSLVRGRSWTRHSRKGSRNPMVNYYKCEDNKWLMHCEPQSDRFWSQFCRVHGISELEKDPRFENSIARREHARELIEILDKVFIEKTRDEWLSRLEEEGYQGGYAPIYDVDEASMSPELLENDYVVEYDHPVFGHTKLPGFPVEFEKTRCRIQREAPEHGQHTEEILQDILGYDWDKISQLKEEGVT